MNQRLLLGSTALVGAGVLFAGGANQAHAQASPMKVTLSGYTEIGIHSATRNSLNEPGEGPGTGDQGYTGFMDTELHIQAQATTESGIIYGSYVAIDLFQPEDQDSQSNVHTDEANLFFSGGFGRVELGRQDGAEDVMFVGAEDAQSGTGGIDGDNKNLPTVYHVSLGELGRRVQRRRSHLGCGRRLGRLQRQPA
jgi:outer membrane protein OmpU